MNTNTENLFEAKIYQPLVKSFEKLTDLRSARGIRHSLKPISVLLFLIKLGGADTSAEIADWISLRFDVLKQLLLDLDWKRATNKVT